MMSEPHMQNQGVGSVYFVWFGKGSLPFFLERGSMTNFAKPSAFSRFLKSFAGTLDFFSGPAAFCGTERGRGPLWGCRAEWSKMAAGSLKIVEGYKQIDFKGRENCRRLCTIVKDPFPNKKMEVILYEPHTYTGLNVFIAKSDSVTF